MNFFRKPWTLLLVLIASVNSFAEDYIEQGWTLKIYDIGESIAQIYPLMPGQHPNINLRVRELNFDLATEENYHGFRDFFLLEATGFIESDRARSIHLRISSDDGSLLYVNDELLINNDGLHAIVSQAARVELKEGKNEIRVLFFNEMWGKALRVEYRYEPSQPYRLLDSSLIQTKRLPPFLTAPGLKKLLKPGAKLRPGNGLPLQGAHPGYQVESIRPEGFEPRVASMAFVGENRLALATNVREKAEGSLYMIDNITGPHLNWSDIHERRNDLYEPLGMHAVGDRLFVSERERVLEFWDSEDSGFENHSLRSRTFAEGWVSNNFHHFSFGMAQLKEFLYLTLSVALQRSGDQAVDPPNRGSVMRLDSQNGDIDYVAGGLRTPNGVAVGPENTLMITDNQGAWLPASKLHVFDPQTERPFFGHYNHPDGEKTPFQDKEITPAAVLFPQGEAGLSPSQPLYLKDHEFAGPFKNQIFVGDVTLGGIRRVQLEKVKSTWQGAVFRFSQGFESGVNRLLMGADGKLYIGGVGYGGNWSWDNPETGEDTFFALQRLKKLNENFFDILKVEHILGGFRVHLSQPLKRGQNFNKLGSHWQYYYKPTKNYGGVKYGIENLAFWSKISEDRKILDVLIPELKEGRVVHLNLGEVESASGARLVSTEIWYTLNKKL